MTKSSNNGRFLQAMMKRVSLLTVLALAGCGGVGLNCGGCANDYVYPQSGLPNGVAPIDDGVRMRLTEIGLDFLEANLKDILVGALGTDPNDPNTIRFEITDPISIGVGTLGVGDVETYPTTILIDAEELGDQLDFELNDAQNSLRVNMRNIPFGLDARLFQETSIAGINMTAGCDIDGTATRFCDGNGPCGFLTDISFDITIIPDVGTGNECDVGVPQCLKLRTEVSNFDLGEFGAESIEITSPPPCNSPNNPVGCSPECSDTFPFTDSNGDRECLTLCFLNNLAANFLAELAGILEGLLEPLLAPILQTAINNALGDIDGAPVAVQSRLADLPLPTSGATLDLGYAIAPTGNAFDVNCPAGNCSQTRGMDMIFKSGLEAAPDPSGELGVPHPCVNPITGPSFAQLYGSGEFRAPTAEALTGEIGGDPYHVGLSVARMAVNQGVFAAYNAGLLCIELDSDAIHELTNGGFPLSVGTLDLLTEGKLRQFAPTSAPAVITVMPTTPPTIDYGAGTDEEGHIILDWENVEVSFYVYMYERFTRVFAVETNIAAQLSLFADAETNTLQLSIVDGPTIDGFETTYNELLPDVDFAEVLSSLVGIAFDAILSEELAFDFDIGETLGSSLGIDIGIDFNGIETVPPASREFLNVYLTMTDGAQPRTPYQPVIARLNDSERLVRHRHKDLMMPKDTVELTIEDGREGPLEVFAQVDFGTWRGPYALIDNKVVIKDAKLMLTGEHKVKVRVRQKDSYRTMTPATEVTVTLDAQKPIVSLKWQGESVRALGFDVGSTKEELRYSYSYDRQAFGEFTSKAQLSADELEGVRRLSVKAKDRSGNVSKPYTLDLHR